MEQKPVDCGIAFAEGYRAGRTGISYTDNPHRVGSAEAAAWLDGWNEGSTRRAWIRLTTKLTIVRSLAASAEDRTTNFSATGSP
jgi:ribosome modulation factor